MSQQTLLEKYEPYNFDDIFLPERIKRELKEKQKQLGFRILFYSSPGTGKTSSAKILTFGINAEVMYLSGSNDFTIDVFRSKVTAFASGFSVMNKIKFIIIDEAENIRDNLQDSFKIILDQCKSVNFIFITNEKEKMNEAIISRCTPFDYNFVGEELKEQKINYVSFIKKICNNENIQFTPDGLKSILKLKFPDFRNTIVQLQQLKDSGLELNEVNLNKFSDSGKQMVDLYELVENNGIDAKTLYQELTKFKGKEKECFLSLGEPFFIYLNEKNMCGKTLDSAVILDKYCDRLGTSINKFVTFCSCIVELKTLFR